jgi:predicted O-methyltransferase YrrM
MFPPLPIPQHDPAAIFEIYRGQYATQLLVAAVADFKVFELLAAGPQSFAELRERLGLAERPAQVLITALRAMEFVEANRDGRLTLTPTAAEHLLPGKPFDVTGYLLPMADQPGVREMVERLLTNEPAGKKPNEQGAAFIFREGLESAMEQEESARRLTLALAGRAKNVAPVLAERVSLADARVLVDVGGGTGIYSIAWLRRHAQLRAVVWDRPEVLKVAREMAAEYGVADRLECVPGDMFRDPVPAGDVCLLSNVLHDWDAPQCAELVTRCATALAPGGRMLIHDVLLNDALDGPLPVALYSAALFSLTEGRAYSAAEFQGWLRAASLKPEGIVSTMAHCAVLTATKPASC